MSSMMINGSAYSPYQTPSANKAADYPGMPENADFSQVKGTGENPSQTKRADENASQAKKAGEECKTCKNRKYQDVSDEANVSFKAAAHVSPQSAGAAVRAHEGQHVSNAYKKANLNNGKVLRASVTIHTAVCPECGRSYVSGGTTSTQIKYYNEENPYQKDLKTTDGVKYRGMNVNTTT